MNETNDKIIIELYDQAKQIHKYELLDIILYDEDEYAVMLPEYSFDGEVEIFKLKHSSDKSATLYKPETNNYINMQVYEIFKEKFTKK
jgi:hypothetical protein